MPGAVAWFNVRKLSTAPQNKGSKLVTPPPPSPQPSPPAAGGEGRVRGAGTANPFQFGAVLRADGNPLEVSAQAFERLLTALQSDRSSVVLARVVGRILGPSFYDAADLNGLLLWQESAVPGRCAADVAFQTEAVRQVSAMVRQLSSHPAIAIWGIAGPATRSHGVGSAIQDALSCLDPTRLCHEV